MKPKRPADALLIVDMQAASFADGGKHDVPGVVERINRLARRVRDGGGRVVFIQHDGRAQDGLTPGTPGWQILPTLETAADDLFVRKTLNDAFANTPLFDELVRLSVSTLAVAGWATDHCVDSTIRSAISRGFHVVVPSDAHTVSDRAHLSAAQIIEHHNRTWAGLIATPPVRVASTCELL